jgi:plastocyanin
MRRQKQSFVARLLALAPLCLYVLSPTASTASNIEGQVVVSSARDNGNAIVYIDKIAGKRFTPPSAPIPLDQVNLTFTPHVLPVIVGATVAFPNSDEIRHNVFSPGPPRFDLGTYPQKTTKYYLFDKPGVWTLLCNVHAEMSAYVVVVETPYFARTEKDGRFVLKDVPPGKYTLKVWHEKAKPATVVVDVAESPTLNVPVIELKR